MEIHNIFTHDDDDDGIRMNVCMYTCIHRHKIICYSKRT